MELIPKIHAYFMCYNEERILPFLIKHYSTFCKKITILDNYSTDNTEEICSQFKHVAIKKFDTQNTIHDEIYRQLKNNVYKESRGIFDYVIVADADEFLFHPNIISLLNQMYNNKCDIINTTGYDVVAEENYTFINNDILNDNTLKLARQEYEDKNIIFNPNIDINYEHGCHKCRPYKHSGSINRCESDKLTIKHFKYLGVQYYLDRHRVFRSRLSEYNKILGLGTQYMKNTDEEFIKVYRERLSNAIQ